MNENAIIEALRCSNQRCPCKRARSGKGNVHCPAHDDKNPSCSVSQDNSTVLVHCHAGCGQKAVISCYWERLTGFSGDFDDLEANGLGASNVVLTIKSTDAGFKSSNCGTWTKTG